MRRSTRLLRNSDTAAKGALVKNEILSARRSLRRRPRVESARTNREPLLNQASRQPPAGSL